MVGLISSCGSSDDADEQRGAPPPLACPAPAPSTAAPAPSQPPAPPAPPPPASPPTAAPTITTQPVGRTVYAGQAVTFSVVATEAAQVRWQRSLDGTSDWVDVAGATSASYTSFPSVGSAWLRAIASNALGSATSQPALLTAKGATLSLLAGALESAASAFPTGVATDAAGNVYASDAGAILQVSGTASTVLARTGVGGWGFARDAAGNFYLGDGAVIYKITPDATLLVLAGSATEYGDVDGNGAAARFNRAAGVALGPGGDLFVADGGNCRVRKVSPAGVVSTVATMPDQCRSSAGGFERTWTFPTGVAVDASGYIYAAGAGAVRKISPTGEIGTLAGVPGQSGSADGQGSAAGFGSSITGLVVDAGGTLFVADADNHTLRTVSPAGVVATLAGQAGAVGRVDAAGAAARFAFPGALALGPAGELYVSDIGNRNIRKVTRAGEVSTFAALEVLYADGTGGQARFFEPAGLAAAADDTVYVADTRNHVIRRINPCGEVSTLAGLAGTPGSADGVGAAARFNRPEGVAVDARGNVYVADSLNYTVRVITPAGAVTTLAGQAGAWGRQDGVGAAARFAFPRGLALDANGAVYVADSHAIRKVAPGGAVTTFLSTSAGPSNSVAIGAEGHFYVTSWGDGKSYAGRYAPDGTGLAGLIGGARDAGPPYGWPMSATLGPIAASAPGVAHMIEGSRVSRILFDEVDFESIGGFVQQSVARATVVPVGSSVQLGENGRLSLFNNRGIAALSNARLAISTGNAVVIASWP